MRLLKASVLYSLFLIAAFLRGQELPPIEVYSPRIYGGANQNWAISQAENNYIYVANDKGLLEFNGAEWTLYPSPNETIIRSVRVAGDRIYTGCYMEFGYWQKNETGDLNYFSLSEKLPEPMIEDEHFWNIIAYEEWMLFQSLNRIYLYNTKTSAFKVINSQTTLTKMFKVDTRIYFQKIQDGFYTIENGKAKLVSDAAVVKDHILVNVFSFQNKLLLQTQESGFYVLDDTKLSPWDIPANAKLAEVSVYSSIQLEDKSFVMGTISNGMIHLTPQGAVNYEINRTNGLSNNTVLGLFEDRDNNIWLGLDNGINCINIKSPFRIYNDDAGLLGTVYASAIHRGYLYLGTNQGLFYKKTNSNTGFSFVEGTKRQVWGLTTYKDVLFCGHNSGTFIVDEGKATRIVNTPPGTWNIKPLPGNEELLLQGNYNGLNVLIKKNGSWQLRNKLKGFENSSRFFEVTSQNEIFVNHEYKGVYRLKVNNDYTKVLNVNKEPNLLKGANSSLVKYNTAILYADKNGIFKYAETDNSFVKDSLLSSIFKDEQYTSGKLIFDAKNNKLWAFTNKNISYVSLSSLSDAPKINKIPVPSVLRKEMTGYENISHIQERQFLLGTSDGYIIIDLEKINSEKEYTIRINSIGVNALNKQQNKVSGLTAAEFKNKENNIAFTYSVAEYDKYLEVAYQYRLEGMHDDWSTWASTPEVLFKNLSYGTYTFNVRARAGNTLSQNTATFTFTIKKPWYVSNTMVALYVISFLLLITLTHNLYKRYYRKQRERLLKRAERELELKELENKQQRIIFDNEQLKKDIEAKNRELAISTMSMIKKNQFLSDIKNELKNNKEGKSPANVIKIIDKNLNSTDDWKFFEEAFNNADKDFLKKVKEKHANLTPNDLRICAYLRLNLSSKEIASLLNISPRSVEIKRYRLRKKMSLPHKQNLVNYILEI